MSLAFTVTAGGAFLVSLDVAVANAVLPAIGDSFAGSERSALSWVITAYVIAFAAALVPAGRLADRAGRRRVFMAGLATFAAGSAVCGMAPSLSILLLGRVVQGLGAAAAAAGVARALALGQRSRAADDRDCAVGRRGRSGDGDRPARRRPRDERGWVAVGIPRQPADRGRASGFDPAGGERDRAPSRAAPCGPSRGAPSCRSGGAARSRDIGGDELGDRRPRTAGAVGGGLLLSWAFVRRSLAAGDPVLDLKTLRRRQFALVTTATVLYSASFFGLLFTFVLFLIGDWHLSIVQAGLCTAPAAVVVVLLSTRVGAVAKRVGFAPLLAGGAATIAAGLLLTASLVGGSSFRPLWFPLLLLIGVGIGLCYPILSAAAVSGLPPGELAAAPALNQCARQLGAALGVASTVAAIGPATPAPVVRFHVAWLLCAAFAAAAALAAGALGRRPGRVWAATPASPRPARSARCRP